ncbi:MAG: hypothetical protein ACJ0BI_04150 [Paracoccaceae bacterium]
MKSSKQMSPVNNEARVKISLGFTPNPCNAPLVKAPMSIPKENDASKIGNRILSVSLSSLKVSTLAGGEIRPQKIPAGIAYEIKVK